MKDQILSEIRRTASSNQGKPLGRRAFERETGIRYVDWYGKYWKSWGEAIAAAGLEPNNANQRIPDDELLRRFTELTQELGRVPVTGDLLMKRRSDPSFPTEKVFRRFGPKSAVISRVRNFCLDHPEYAAVAALLPAQSASSETEPTQDSPGAITGYVYLIRSGKHHKIGRSNSAGRREYELAIQLPEKAQLLHAIATDDPEGIEGYWHRRFASKRANGEWFRLDAKDVAVFRRRKFQ
jgi:hypothetical protein